MNAVQEFTDQHHPTLLPDAEVYLRQLDALGDSAAYWQFQARRSLVSTYYFLGRSPDVIRHGVRGIELMLAMHFYDRGLMFWGLGGDGELYAATVDALAGQPNGRRRIDQLNAILEKSVVPTTTVAAMDEAYPELAKTYNAALTRMIEGNALVGTSASAIVSNYWVNRPTSDSATVPVNTGQVSVIEFGSFTCGICLVALKGLDRLHQQFPRLQAIFVTWTVGSWGNRLVEPEQEAAHLKEAFVHRLRATVPIALWKSKKVCNPDGGIAPEGPGPNFANYPMLAKPTTWIVDGRGIIRRVILGFDRDKEAQIAKTVTFLQAAGGS
jgi:hypothetical protein